MAKKYKLLIFIFIFNSTFISAQELPHLKTGFNLLKPTKSELQKKLKSLPLKEKKRLHQLQTLKILPEIIVKNVPFILIESIDFSITDDDYQRSQKFLKLGTTLINNKTFSIQEDKNYLAYICFIYSYNHLKKLQYHILEENKSDYFLSLAQIELWACTRFLKTPKNHKKEDKQYALKLINEAYGFLDYAKILLFKNLPNTNDFATDIKKTKDAVDQAINVYDEIKLLEIAESETTKLQISDYITDSYISQHYTGIKQAKLNNAKEILLNKSLDEGLIHKTLYNYELLLDKKFSKLNLSILEKREIIKSQGFLVNLERMISTNTLSTELKRLLKKQSIKLSLGFYKTYQHHFLNTEIEELNSKLHLCVNTLEQKIDTEVKKLQFLENSLKSTD